MIALALLLTCQSPAAAAPVGPAAPEPALLLDVSWEGDGLLTGRAARLEVRAPRAIRELHGTIDSRRIVALPASADGRLWIVLAPVSVEAAPVEATLSLEAALDDGTPIFWARPVPVVEAPYDERKLTVGKQFMQPSRAQRARARKEARILAAVLEAVSPERLWRGSFAKPTAGLETSPFGTRRTYNDKKKSRHLGLDLDGKTGDAIVAANRGRVALAANRFYSGGTVIVDHGQGVFTMYFHMSRIDVKKGDLVEKGQGLGAIGATGQVTGPHLHFSVKLAGLYVDPKYVLALDLSQDALDETAEAIAHAE
jgi:murein DD-endopeptidase MepM/ murein hydrolase activator NlpD